MLAYLFFLAEEHAAAGGHGAGHGSDALLDPHSWGLVFWSAITFGVVLFILRKAAWGPILEGLEKREKTIADAIAAAQRDRVEAAKALEEHRKKLEQVRNEAQAILNETAADSKRMMEESAAKAAALGKRSSRRSTACCDSVPGTEKASTKVPPNAPTRPPMANRAMSQPISTCLYLLVAKRAQRVSKPALRTEDEVDM